LKPEKWSFNADGAANWSQPFMFMKQ